MERKERTERKYENKLKEEKINNLLRFCKLYGASCKSLDKVEFQFELSLWKCTPN